MPTTPEVWLSSFQANTQDVGPNGSQQNNSVVIQLTNGNIVVLWVDTSDAAPGGAGGADIVGQIYDPLGNPLGSEFRANQSFFADDEYNFDAAALENGGFVVVYEDDPGPDDAIAIRATEWHSTPDGTLTLDATLTIATSPDAGDIVRRPAVDAQPDGSYMVVYEHFDSSVPDRDLRGTPVTAAGVVGSEIIFISGSDSATSSTDVAALASGLYVGVYDYDGTDDALAYSIRSTTGASPTGGAFVADTATNGDTDSDASVVALESGGFVISWTNVDPGVDTDVEFQRYEVASGSGTSTTYATAGGVQTVNGGAFTDNNNESHLIGLEDGGFVVAYDDDETNVLSVQRFNATGTATGTVVSVESVAESDPSGVGLGDGRFIFGWTENGLAGSGSGVDVRVQIMDTRDLPNSPGVYTPDQWVVGTIGNDIFTPSTNAEFTHGWDGDDVITESGGTREYYGDAGNDRINVTSPINSDLHDGGTGNDTVDWSGASAFVSGATFDLGAGTATIGASSEVMVNFENLNGTDNSETIIGSSVGNILNGNDGADTIRGGDGNDTIDGGDGNDSLLGEGGTDTLIGGNGNDTLDGGLFSGQSNGGSGNDTFIQTSFNNADNIDGGADIDTFDATASGLAILNADLGPFGQYDFGPILGLQLDSIEVFLGSALGDDVDADGTPGTTLIGNGGNDTLTGGFNEQTISGGDGDDLIDGGFAVSSGVGDILSGDAGNDTISGANGNDNIDGGSDDDVITGNGGADFILGGTGRDDLSGGDDADTINAGGGADTVNGGNGADTLRGEDGNDVIFGGSFGDLIFGGNQHDTLRGEDGPDTLIGGGGNDSLIGGGNTDSILGGDGADTILGNLGNDTLEGGTGTDSITGGDGRDLIAGNTGNDTLIGNKADDTIDGGGGSDLILGGDDNDSLIGQSGNDTIDGGNGNDYVEGNDLNDDLSGSAGLDTLLGGGGDDTIVGGGDADLIYGEDGNDLLLGAEGNDTIYGNNGNDTIDGGADNDRLFGGPNADTFQFQALFGNDSVQGFGAGTDTIEMIGYVQGDLTLSNSGGNTLVEISGQTDTIEIVGVVLTDFSDFVFS
ncbi:calcium-binding protein [Salipiger sp.]|uniref:calcium-binding protein n=1 Tax=Salipiger sp. TaxID=2078585 RepID=UPI003A98167A